MAEKAMLMDMEKCIACRSCQVACKQWNELPAEKTKFFAEAGGYQNPAALSPDTYTLIRFNEIEEKGEVKWLFNVHRCMQCVDPACVEACPEEPKAMMHDEKTGAVWVNSDLCIGCETCLEACPFGIPTFDEDEEIASKCKFCHDRISEGLEPSCAKACPTDCLVYGDRDEILKLAKKAVKRLKKSGRNPVLYGKKELKTGTKKIFVLPEALEHYPDLPTNPKPGDVGMLQEFLKPFGPGKVTAAMVGLAMLKMKEAKANKQTVEVDEV